MDASEIVRGLLLVLRATHKQTNGGRQANITDAVFAMAEALDNIAKAMVQVDITLHNNRYAVDIPRSLE